MNAEKAKSNVKRCNENPHQTIEQELDSIYARIASESLKGEVSIELKIINGDDRENDLTFVLDKLENKGYLTQIVDNSLYINWA